MAQFNTTGQSFDAAEFTTAERLAFLTSWGAAQVNGDSGEDFEAANIKIINRLRHTDGETMIRTNIDNDLRFYTKNDIGIHRFLHQSGELAPVVALSYTPFTGCHIIPNENQNFKLGELVCIEATPSKGTKQPDWRGRYANKGQKGIFGIVFDSYEEPKEKTQIGVNKFYSIACLGDMKILCNNENGDIEYGDELCASSIKGEAMKADENIHRRKVCGIAGRSHKFTSNKAVLLDTTKE